MQGYFVNAQVIKIIWMAICHITTKWKGGLEEVPIYDSASLNDATLSLESQTISPVSPASPA